MEILSGDFGSMGRLAISLNGLKHIKLNLLIVIALSLHTQDKYVTYYNNNKSNTMHWKWKKVHTTLWQIVSFLVELPSFGISFCVCVKISDFTNFWHFSSQKLCVFYLPATYNQDVLALTISTGWPLLSSFPFPCQVTSAVSVPFFPKTTQAWSSDKAKWTPEIFYKFFEKSICFHEFF